MERLKKLYRHWRQGTLWRRLISALRGERVEDVRWYGAQNQDQAVSALVSWGRMHAASGGQLLVVGEDDEVTNALNLQLKAGGLNVMHVLPGDVGSIDNDQAQTVVAVLSAQFDVAGQTESATRLARHPVLASRPFEYVNGLDSAVAQFRRQDEYATTHFVSPVLLDSPSPYEIYQESLQHFEQKCGLRDYLDLYQVLSHLVRNGIEGDIAEFGSYKGHSGWLIARSLQALGDPHRRVFLFDTFAGFPEEKGLDHFWTHTHRVDFESIRAKFTDWPNVQLVRGDFTETLAASEAGQLALAYIDCDSYRATHWLIETLWPERITPRGALVFEDYGHPALLGNRVAVHSALPEDGSAIRFYSQFSGLYIAYRA